MDALTHWEGTTVEECAQTWEVPALHAFASVGSTNDVLGGMASVAPPGAVVIAEEQTSGRGRRGAEWHSPPGSGLWLSFLAGSAPESTPIMPLLAGLAVARAIEGVLERAGGRRSAHGLPMPVEVGIKWPNDVFIEGRKVAGVLCEGVDGRVVVGVGVNVRTPEQGFPGDVAARAGSVADFSGGETPRSELAARLVRALVALTEDAGAQLPPDTLREIGTRDVLAGHRVETEQAGEGVAEGIESSGGLLLRRPDGTLQTVVAGSVRRI